MTLNELLQVKKDREQGIIISPKTLANVLEWAIELTKHHEAGKVSKNASDDS
jgi:hypothetical protein